MTCSVATAWGNAVFMMAAGTEECTPDFRMLCVGFFSCRPELALLTRNISRSPKPQAAPRLKSLLRPAASDPPRRHRRRLGLPCRSVARLA
eukprot:6173103-Pleurochrysis_carterae.AAC.2